MTNPREVIAVIAAANGVTADQITGPKRHRQYVQPRDVAALVLRWCGLSLPEIGRELGGRDHTTVMDAIRRGKAKPDVLAAAADVAVRCGLEASVETDRATVSKDCSRCKQTKPLTEFYEGHGLYGHHASCKLCERDAARNREAALRAARQNPNGEGGRPLRPEELVVCPKCSLRGPHECLNNSRSTGMSQWHWTR